MSDWREYLEHLIYRCLDNPRFTQDSPVLPDVWIEYGRRPHEPIDLLLTPTRDVTPGQLALELTERLALDRESEYHEGFLEKLAPDSKGKRSSVGKATRFKALKKPAEKQLWPDKPMVAYNQSTVAVRLWFHQLIRAILPLSVWWHNFLKGRDDTDIVAQFADRDRRSSLGAELAGALDAPKRYDTKTGSFTQGAIWMTRVAGCLCMVTDSDSRAELKKAVLELPDVDDSTPLDTYEDWSSLEPQVVRVIQRWNRDRAKVVEAVFRVIDRMEPADLERPPTLWNVNRNRPTELAIYRSIETVKADAATRVFEVTGRDIRWAVLDSGIDATHHAFRRRDELGDPVSEQPFEKKDPAPRRGDKWKNNTRIVATYDFTRVRDLLSGDPEVWKTLPPPVQQRIEEEGLLDSLRRSLQTGRMVDWELLEPILRVPHDDTYTRTAIPEVEHGTHVAGILAADWRAQDSPDDPLVETPGLDTAKPNYRKGVCPEIELYDLRVIDENGGDEFSTMAALQFVRSLNSRRDYTEIHGANLSLSILHEVSNYACGRTPVCEECERLTGAGIVVVAAAGNKGRTRYMSVHGRLEEGYRNISITDPGNAQGVITVGATHRREPHSYGVSYFSSRGPTGDGRLKPDLVAPGEKILSTFPKNKEEYLDGTSMAAPHVSGAAALLMSRHTELVGEPARIKQILCDTATDLGREPYFQGAGLLDILRALQSR